MKKGPIILILLFSCLALASCSRPASGENVAPPVQFQQYVPPGRPERPLTGLLDDRAHEPYFPASQDLARPSEGLTRGEAASILYTLLGEKPPPAEKAHFQDIPEHAWYREAAEALGELGALDPLGTQFAGDYVVTRSEFTWLLAQFFPFETGGKAFSDVPAEHWAYAAIETGSALGWFQGDSFRPDDPLTRAEATVIVNRALGRRPDQTTLASARQVMLFTDLPPSHWSYGDIMEAALPHEHGEDGRWRTYHTSEASRAPGCYLLNGELYCVQENGCYARNTQVGRLAFDESGRYTTGLPELDEQLTQLVQAKTVEEWPLALNLRLLYNYICNNFDYLPAGMVEAEEEDWEAEFALEMLERGKGNCYSYAGLFTLLARKLGYQAWGVSGDFCNSFQEWTTHGWVEIEINGEILLCDPEIEGVYAPNRGLEWDLYLKRYGETPTTYFLDGIVYGEEPDWF